MGEAHATRRITFDPAALTSAQRTGAACVLCHKRWPRPAAVVGALPGDAEHPDTDGLVRACEECATAIEHAVLSAAGPAAATGRGRTHRRRPRWLPRALTRSS